MPPSPPSPSRRAFLRQSTLGFGWLAFCDLAAARQPHFPARAKRVILLCMRGGPSQLDTFDYKPKLNADTGKTGNREGTQLLGSKWKFTRRGQSGLWMSELFPQLATQADELCMVNSMTTDLLVHSQAFLKMHTGTNQFVRPSLGAWTHYGLGSLNDNLPGFITITPPNGWGGTQNYGSAFLPAVHQGAPVGTDAVPIATAAIPNLVPKQPAKVQRAEIDLIQAFNRAKLARDGSDPQVEGVIESFELAYRMQSDMVGSMDLSTETEATRKLYGIGEKTTDDFGRKCLLARRLVQSGVRFVEVAHGDWDQHFNLSRRLEEQCVAVDKPVTALLTDLKALGLLQDTLVIWSGEFGRTPHAENSDGRDHNVTAFTFWMAGGGVKPGFCHGRSDDYGYDVVEGKMTVHDWHATILHLMGLDHQKLTYRYAGRDMRLTDVHGNVVREVLA